MQDFAKRETMIAWTSFAEMSASHSSKPKCFNCGILCHVTHATPKGQMCGTCHQYFQRTGNIRYAQLMQVFINLNWNLDSTWSAYNKFDGFQFFSKILVKVIKVFYQQYILYRWKEIVSYTATLLYCWKCRCQHQDVRPPSRSFRSKRKRPLDRL